MGQAPMMQPGMQPGMQPMMQPGMQPMMQQPGMMMQPGMQPGMMPGVANHTSSSTTTVTNITNVVNNGSPRSERSERSAHSEKAEDAEKAEEGGSNMMYYIFGCLCCVIVCGAGGAGASGVFSGDKTKSIAARLAANKLQPFAIRHSNTFYPMMKSFFFKKKNIEICSGVNCSGYLGKQGKTKTGKKCQAWSGPKAKANGVDLTNPSMPKNYLIENYCRNPAVKGKSQSNTIWCYTEDKINNKWEESEVLPPGKEIIEKGWA
jgi:hypothetical protein